jgi:HEXXH motif-containing protein
MPTVSQQMPPVQAAKPELQCLDFVELALMPDAVITAELVRDSALDRLDDFRALAEIVLASPALAAHRESWQQAAIGLETLPGHERMGIGSSPLYRRWLHATGRGLIAGAPPSAVEPLLASVANYVQGFADVSMCGGMLMSRGGCIETWDCAGAIVLPAGHADGPWRCRRKGEWIHLSRPCEDGQTLSSCLAEPEAMLPRSRIVVRNDLPGLRVSLDETRTPERGNTVRELETDGRERSYPQGRHRPIVEAAQALLSVWPEEYEDWRSMMRAVVPRLPPSGWQMEGFTISSMQGAAWIHPTNTLRTLESLVHEHSHVKLRYVEEAVPLLQPVQPSTRFPVGWRTDPRPVIGFFEGVYVHLHCVIALVRYVEGGRLDAMARREAAARLDELRAQAREGFELLRGHARFTAAGQGFLRWAETTLRDH